MRKIDRKDYINFTAEMRAQLATASKAADVGGIAAYRYLELENLLPEGSKLTAPKICNWLSAPPKSLDAEEFALVLRAFKELADNPEKKAAIYQKRGPTLSARAGMHRQPVTPELRAKVEALKYSCKNQGIQTLLERSGAPKGLNPSLISAIISGRAETLHVKHIEHLELLFERYGVR